MSFAVNIISIINFLNFPHIAKVEDIIMPCCVRHIAL